MVSKFQQKSARKNTAGKSGEHADKQRQRPPGSKQAGRQADEFEDEDRLEAGEPEQDDEEREDREAEDDVERDVRHTRPQPGRS